MSLSCTYFALKKNLDRELSGYDARIVYILHDEIIVEAREDIAGDVAVTIKECMERVFTEIFPDVPFVVKPEIRDTWGLAFQNLQNRSF